VAAKRQGLAPEVRKLIEQYVDQDRKANIDWSSPQERAAQLQVLAQDAEAALELAAADSDNADVRSVGWLLTKIVGDDIVSGEEGAPQIGKGTAPDRVVSLTEPEMRHGHKSKARRFDGFKVLTSTDQSSEMILDISDVPAAGSEGVHLLPAVERIETRAEVQVERVIGDGAFGSGALRAACAAYKESAIDLVSPLAQPRDAEVAKSAFRLDLDSCTATCPQGHLVVGRQAGKEGGQQTFRFTFPRAVCETCPLFARCVRSKKRGRTVCTAAYEAYLQAARARQQTEAFKLLYRLRPAIERKQAELVQNGLRHTRYLGRRKRQLQRLWTGAAVNLRRLFGLAEAKGVDLRAALSDPPWQLAPALVT
jgi:hypothetical protein